VIDTDNGRWRRRLPYVDVIGDESMCESQRRQKADGKTLGVFRPAEVIDLRGRRKITLQDCGLWAGMVGG
jgi:hypothetical protein